MKRLLQMILIAMLSLCCHSVFAQNQCPLHLPFRIDVQFQGMYKFYHESDDPNDPQHHDTVNIVDRYGIILDTSRETSLFNYAGDSLTYFDSANQVYSDSTSFTTIDLSFDPGNNRITTCQIAIDKTFYVPWQTNTSYRTVWKLVCQNLQYQNDSILFNDVAVSVADSQDTMNFTDVGPPFYQYSSGRTLLSGKIQIVGSHTETSAVALPPAQSGLATYMMNGSLECIFSPAPRERVLEIYTPLGVRAGSYSISPSAMSASLSHLTPGLYFVRLDGALAKVYVAD